MDELFLNECFAGYPGNETLEHGNMDVAIHVLDERVRTLAPMFGRRDVKTVADGIVPK